MEFKILNVFESRLDLEQQRINLEEALKTTVIVFKSVLDGNIFKADICITSIEQLKELSHLLNGDLVILGADSDMIMTLDSARTMGLN